MRDETRYLLDRLDKTVDDTRAIGRLGISLTVTFALALLAMQAKGEDFVCGLVTWEGGFFTACLVLLFVVFYRNLAYNELEIDALIAALHASVAQPRAPAESADDFSPADLSRALGTKPLLVPGTRKVIARIRLGVVGVLLLVCWVNVVDIIPNWDLQGTDCQMKRKEKSRRAGSHAAVLISPNSHGTFVHEAPPSPVGKLRVRSTWTVSPVVVSPEPGKRIDGSSVFTARPRG
jgi:hypothetical protein